MKLKTYFLMLALGICSAAMTSCDDDKDDVHVPDKLKQAFTRKYPGAKAEWKTRQGYYIADFRYGSRDAEAWFTPDGDWRMTETEIPYAALPEAVKSAFGNSDYGTWKVDDVDMLERKGLEPVYVLEVKLKPHEMKLHYNAEGILIKAVADRDDDSADYLPVELPEWIRTFLEERYPGSRVVETEREQGILEVDIIQDGIAKEVHFGADGNWLATSWEVEPGTLPAAVLTTLRQELATNYAGYEVDDTEWVETPTDSYYRIELEADKAADAILKIHRDGSPA